MSSGRKRTGWAETSAQMLGAYWTEPRSSREVKRPFCSTRVLIQKRGKHTTWHFECSACFFLFFVCFFFGGGGTWTLVCWPLDSTKFCAGVPLVPRTRSFGSGFSTNFSAPSCSKRWDLTMARIGLPSCTALAPLFCLFCVSDHMSPLKQWVCRSSNIFMGVPFVEDPVKMVVFRLASLEKHKRGGRTETKKNKTHPYLCVN